MSYLPQSPDQVVASNSTTTPLAAALVITGASFSSPNLTCTGAWGTGGSNAFAGKYFGLSGFTGAAVGNNGLYLCTASAAGSITVTNTGGFNGTAGSPVAGFTFIGTAVDCTAQVISSVTMSCDSDASSATNGMQVQWSQDNTNWDHIQHTTSTAGMACVLSDKVRARYFRVVHINGLTIQTYFRLQCLISTTDTSGTVRDLASSVESDDEAQLVRSVITGKNINTGIYKDVVTDYYGNLNTIAGGAASDAFQRARSSEPITLFESQFQYDTQPLLFSNSLTGAGAAISKTSNESSVTITTGAGTSGNTAILQTKAYHRYEPGKSQLIVMTGLLGAQKSNVRSRIGYFDANDGLYFEMDGTLGLSVNQRSSTSGSPVNTQILQANWNLDKCDGTGPSGFNINTADTQIFLIDMQWLGTGRVRFGFFDQGVYVVAHQVYNDNVIVSPYMNTANLPMRYEIANTGTAGTSTSIKAICMTAISEGGQQVPNSYSFGVGSTMTSAISVGTTVVPIISIRPKTTFNSLTNRSKITLTTAEVLDTSTNALQWQLIYNPTLGGGTSFADVNGTYSGVQYDIASTTVSGGIVLATGFVQGGSKANTQIDFSKIDIPFTLDFAGSTQDILSLCAVTTASTVNTYGVLNWLETR